AGVVVDDAVAVVVEVVARLGARALAALAGGHAELAHLVAEVALALIGAAGGPLVDQAAVRVARIPGVLVDEAVAVVVLAVAGLGRAPDRAHAHLRRVDAAQAARRALAHVGAAAAHVVQALVDHAVAVVVEAVAGLGAHARLRAARIGGAARRGGGGALDH